ncbi:MAG: hypothetical protein ACRC0G_11960 [Fusobacteriaceae bacterium]
MNNITDLLNLAVKKNAKYYKPTSDLSGIGEAYSSNIMNMKTVKEGTATAGSFCNKIMEIAFCSAYINVISARVISDIFQRIALDSKHNGAGTSYKDSDWFKISNLLNTVKFNSNLETTEKAVLDILKDKSVVTVVAFSEEIATVNDLDDLF